MRDLPPAGRAPLLILGFVALAAGVAGGLSRLGTGVPAPAAGIAWHGALMAAAFFGTLIALERAVAIGRLWAYGAPAVSAIGGVALLAGLTGPAFWMFAGGAAVFSLASLAIYARHRALHTGVLAAGALCLLGANLWLAFALSLDRALPFWIAFFVLTIGGERLELSRLVPVPNAARTLLAVLTLVLAACAAFAFIELLGVVLLAIAAWLARYDLATRTVRARGITRYIAVCLLAGYFWLAFGGVLLALGVWRDAALHAILLGFVFSMVFGHAPVIFPAVLRIALPYRPAFYAPLLVLHASILLRVSGGMAGDAAWLRAGGAGNAIAIALFILTAAALALGARRPSPDSSDRGDRARS
ncbi:MAG: hypothetical protein A3I63_05895 [Betaproteobacteria bacterium RIFCSPLOWO2_02_FULL_66_14]|nr:MAG: hypothetical protein A3I63_05895 [Betaproteobacteria bacterium RIFCSPLOWO2_02_FULL_66_14]